MKLTLTDMNEKKKKPVKKMGRGDYGERDTRLDPYTRKKIDPRDILVNLGEEDDEGDLEDGADVLE